MNFVRLIISFGRKLPRSGQHAKAGNLSQNQRFCKLQWTAPGFKVRSPLIRALRANLPGGSHLNMP